MFWKFNLLPSQVDSLLEKEDVTLQQLLDEDDVLQECKAQNAKLIEFLVTIEHIEALVNLAISTPSADVAEALQYKYAYIACELLTSDVNAITDALITNTDILDKIYAFLDADGELNPLSASFFSKIMGLLTSRKSAEFLEHLQGKEDFVGTLLKHISTSAIMDVLLRLITCIENAETKAKCIQWLNDHELIQKLIGLISSGHSEEKHCNAAQSLCDIVRMSREHQLQLEDRTFADPLLATIESETTLTDLLNNILHEDKCESVLVNGLSVIQIILEQRKPPTPQIIDEAPPPEPASTQDNAEAAPTTAADRSGLCPGIRTAISVLSKRLNDIHHVLQHPPKQYYACMQTTVGALSPPLGNCRLQIARLITTLVCTNNEQLNQDMADAGILNTLLDLYFKYVWNNFLHTQVEQCICAVISSAAPGGGAAAAAAAASQADDKDSSSKDDQQESPPTPPAPPPPSRLLTQLFTDCKLLKRILDAWEDNEQLQKKPEGRRCGYMGHLYRIASHIAESTDSAAATAASIKQVMQEVDEETKERWQKFTTGELAETKKQNKVDFKDVFHLNSGSEDEEPELRDIPFPQESAMQEAFSDYQNQHMTSNFIDQFGFSEEGLGDQDVAVDTDRLSSIKFENTPTSQSMFEQACDEKIRQFDDDDDEVTEEWKEREITFDLNATQSRSLGTSSDSGSDDDNSSDSEEELASIPRIHQIIPSTTSTPKHPPSTLPKASSPSPPADGANSTGGKSAATAEENMDIDSSDWPNSMNESAMDSAPVAMDTAPWQASSSSDAATTSANASADSNKDASSSSEENWAKFPNRSSSSEPAAPHQSPHQSPQQENWADFSSFDGNTENLCSTTDNQTQGGQRPASPVDMDTSEASAPPSSNSRAQAYVVSSDISDASPARGTTSSSSYEPDSSPDSSFRNRSSGGLGSSNISGEHSSSSTVTSSSDRSSLDSAPLTPNKTTTDADSTSDSMTVTHSSALPMFKNPPLDFAADLSDDDEDVVIASGGAMGGSEAASANNNVAIPRLPLHNMDEADEGNGAIDDDLDDNFDFLASSGLMRNRDGGGRLQLDELSSTASSSSSGASPRPATSPRPTSSADATPPGATSNAAAAAAATADGISSSTSTGDVDALEAARAKAREAMDSFTSMTTPSSSTSRNGPV